MAKQIDVSEAASWSDEEATFNVKYLNDRSRWDEANEILRIRGEAVPEPDPDVDPSGEAIKPSEGPDAPDPNARPVFSQLTAKEVIAYVDDDPIRASEALQAEMEAEKTRPKLIEQLEKIAG